MPATSLHVRDVRRRPAFTGRALRRAALLAGLSLLGCAGRLPRDAARIRIAPMPETPLDPPAFRVGPGDVLEVTYCRKYDGVEGVYLLDVGDLLSVKVDEHPEASSEAVVRADGRITVPIAGDVAVRGLSIAAATERLREGLARRIKSPDVTVTILRAQAKLDEFFATLSAGGGVARTMLVRPDGRLSFPLVGELTVGGRTITEVEADLASRFGPVLRYVHVTVNVKSSPRQRVAVLGEVQKPGLYALDGSLTPLQAVALAGGFLPTASRADIVVARWEPQSRAVLASQRVGGAGDGRAGAERAVLLEPQDIVFVPRSGISNLNLFVDQYIRQVLPFSLSAGAFYDLSDGQRR